MSDDFDIFQAIPLVYPAQSKLYFFCRDAVCEFVLRNGAVPLHPFRMFDYFLGDRLDRDYVRRANNSVVSRADEIWVFGTELADGVLVEIAHARQHGRPVRFFSIATRSSEIVEVSIDDLTFEEELLATAQNDVPGLREVVRGTRTFHSVVRA